MKIVAIVPCRMASTRYPGKPLALILGLPMIEHVRRRLLLCRSLSDVIVATCDVEIRDAVVKAGGKAVMTSDKHVRCTDRVAEAAEMIQGDIFVNIQGDEPLVRPEMVEALLPPFSGRIVPDCTNLMSPITSDLEFRNPNVVKTVVDVDNNALYFSRESIPSYHWKKGAEFRYKQLGIMAFQRKALAKYAALAPTPLEEIESVDMLRFVERGHKVRMILYDGMQSIGVDTPEDHKKVEVLMRQDDLWGKY